VEATPRHLIIVDGSIMQAIPEHPKRDFIFCLSTAFGDAYLFQVFLYLYTNACSVLTKTAFSGHALHMSDNKETCCLTKVVAKVAVITIPSTR
jgi:hypothetical protein